MTPSRRSVLLMSFSPVREGSVTHQIATPLSVNVYSIINIICRQANDPRHPISAILGSQPSPSPYSIYSNHSTGWLLCLASTLILLSFHVCAYWLHISLSSSIKGLLQTPAGSYPSLHTPLSVACFSCLFSLNILCDIVSLARYIVWFLCAK